MPTKSANAENQVVRLRKPVRIGKEVVPENAVMDVTGEIAGQLLGRGLAEETDAVERYPTLGLVSRIDEAPVTGGEKYPIPEGHEVQVPEGMFVPHNDRLVAHRAQAGVGTGAVVMQTEEDAEPYSPPTTATPAVNPFAKPPEPAEAPAPAPAAPATTAAPTKPADKDKGK